MRAAAVVQQLCKSCRTCFMFYCMFCFTCDRSFRPSSNLFASLDSCWWCAPWFVWLHSCTVGNQRSPTYTVWVKKSPPLRFYYICPKRLGIFSPNFTLILYVPIYARLRSCIQLSATLTKLYTRRGRSRARAWRRRPQYFEGAKVPNFDKKRPVFFLSKQSRMSTLSVQKV